VKRAQKGERVVVGEATVLKGQRSIRFRMSGFVRFAPGGAALRRDVMFGAKLESHLLEAFLPIVVKAVLFSKAVQRLWLRVLMPGASLTSRMGYGERFWEVVVFTAVLAWWKPWVKFWADSTMRASPDERKKGVEFLAKSW
jgi:hypothetical protein